MSFIRLAKPRPRYAHCVIAGICVLVLVASPFTAFGLNVEIQPSRKLGTETQSGETRRIRMAQQYGIGYLPLMIIRQNFLIEKHASALGLGNIQVTWNRYPSGKVMNDALQAGFLDVAAGGVTPLLRLWDQTRERVGVKGIAALSTMPLYLNTRNPNVTTIEDFTDKDRIALPAVKKSLQAVVLQMAATQVWGTQSYARLDGLTVSMAHPNARETMLAGNGSINSHFTSPPYAYQELLDPTIHKVLSSYDVLGGPATFTMVWSRAQFRTANPRAFQAIFAALQEAMEVIKKDSRFNAEVYVQQSNSGLSVDFLAKMLAKPEIEFTLVPRHIMKYAKFMQRTGQIKRAPDDWKEVFFPEVYAVPGS